MQRFMGIEGVIVDLVSEITEAVLDFIKNEEEIKEEIVFAEDGKLLVKTNPQFSNEEISFLLKLITELIHH